MTKQAEQLKTTLASLSSEEKAALAHFLIHSLDPQEEKDFEVAWDMELQRRSEEIRNGKVMGQSAESIFQKLQNYWKVKNPHRPHANHPVTLRRRRRAVPGTHGRV